MRRSTISALLIAGVCCMALSACDDDKTVTEQRVKIYPSLDACKVEESVADCNAAFAGAQAQQQATAPQYATMASCEERYGPAACMPYQSSAGSWFIPAMVGFMIGHALSGPVYQPVYVDRGGWAYSGGQILGTYRRGCGSGGGIGCSSGVGVGSSYVYNAGPSGGSGSHAIWTSSAYRAESVTTPVSRGGFGSSSGIGGKSLSGGGDRVGIGTGAVSRGGFGGTASAMTAHGGGS
jgi:uncharacterized protein YgiB involved in biofilm formation